MKRSHSNYPYNPNDPNNHRSGDRQILEEENEELTSELKNKVKNLKSLTIEIGSEIRSQNQFLDEMDNTFGFGGAFLDKMMRRLGIVSKSSHNYHIIILFVFCFFVFLLLWFLLKFR